METLDGKSAMITSLSEDGIQSHTANSCGSVSVSEMEQKLSNEDRAHKNT